MFEIIVNYVECVYMHKVLNKLNHWPIGLIHSLASMSGLTG